MVSTVSPAFLITNFIEKFGPEFLNHLEGISEDLACHESMRPTRGPNTTEGTRHCGTRNACCRLPTSRTECQVLNDSNNFQVKLDVAQFKPEEISVKTVGDSLIVHGKHEEKRDERHGYVSREFTRRYVLPEGVEMERMKSSLSQDGYLTIDAPKKQPEAPKTNERVVPIVRMDAPTSPTLSNEASTSKEAPRPNTSEMLQ